MAIEGQFPKVNGDILYASEVNVFNPKVIGHVRDFSRVITSSGTSASSIGTSITYPGAGSLGISNFFYINKNFSIGSAQENIYTLKLFISGPGLNNLAVDYKSGTLTSLQTVGNSYLSADFNVILTSGTITASGGNIGSPYVFSFGMQSNSAITLVNGNFTILGH